MLDVNERLGIDIASEQPTFFASRLSYDRSGSVVFPVRGASKVLN